MSSEVSTDRRKAGSDPWCPPLAAVVVSILIGVWLTVDLVLGGPMHRLDLTVARAVDRVDIRHTPGLDTFVWLFTQSGARGVILVVVGLLTAYLVRERGVWQPVLRVAVALVLVTATIYAFKLGLGRTAPGYGASLLHADGESYPSGHTANAVLWWGLTVWLARDYCLPARVVRVFTVVAVAAPIATSVAMLALNYHWLTDLITGVAMGVVLLRVLHLIFSTRLGEWGSAPRRTRGGGRDRDRVLLARPGGRG